VTARYDAPNAIDRAFNRVFTFLLGLGLGLKHNYLLEVRGRTTGRLHVVPVDLLDLEGRQFLVAGRGRTHWVRNAEAAGEVALRKGRTRRRFTVRAVPPVERPAILKAYLDRFKPTVQRYFPVRAGSPASDFVDVAEGYPVFELTPR
jgi:deazaflavin-dependent oxidoreductase (nitroreductase family)